MNTETICIKCLAVSIFKPVAQCTEHDQHQENRREIVHLVRGSEPTAKRRKPLTAEQKERARERWMRSYRRHREKRMAQMRERYQSKIEEERAKNRAYYVKNKEAINAKRRAKRAAKG